jgi:membrane protease YdiL (CAAX protease family)
VSRWLRTTPGALAAVSAVTLLALVENSLVPWAPFYLLYAGLAIGLPLALGTYRFGSIRSVGFRGWAAGILVAIALQLAGVVILGLVYPLLLTLAGVPEVAVSGPGFNLNAALNQVFIITADRLGPSPSTWQFRYLIFIALWAGLGEELLYRGYLQGVLEAGRGFAAAALISAAFFALRHATQLALLWPEYPFPAAAAWVVYAFVVGLVFSYIYRRTRSLYLPVFIHYLFNAIPLLGGLLSQV